MTKDGQDGGCDRLSVLGLSFPDGNLVGCLRQKRCLDADGNGDQEQEGQGVSQRFISRSQRVTLGWGWWCFAHKIQKRSTTRKIADFGRPGTPQKVSRTPSLWLLYRHICACGQWKEGESGRDGEVK